MSTTDETSRLTELVNSLHLSPGRADVEGSASVITYGAMKAAGILPLDVTDPSDSILDKMLFSSTRADAIVRKIHLIKTTYFDALSVNGPTIPVNVLTTVDLSTVSSPQELTNVLTSLAVHYVNNNLSHVQHNPFIFRDESEKTLSRRNEPGDKDSEKECLNDPGDEDSETESLNDPGDEDSETESFNDPESDPEKQTQPLSFDLKIGLLVNPKDDDIAAKDDLKEAMTWFHALNLTAEPDGQGKHSEMTVQHVIGGPLQLLSQLPGCVVWSDLKLKYPQILRLSTKTDHPKGNAGKGKPYDPGNASPDIATRPAVDRDQAESENKSDLYYELLQPVVIVGEAKRTATGDRSGSAPGEKDSDYRVQLVTAAHPSLVLLILAYTNGEKFEGTIHDTPLNEDFFIYGIYYDEEKAIVYAHFPWYLSEDNSPGWRFAQTRVKEFKFATLDFSREGLKKSAELRVEFGIAIQAIREHARKLYEVFTSDSFREIIDLVTGWE